MDSCKERFIYKNLYNYYYDFRGRVEFRPETLPYVSARESDLLLLIKEPETNKEFILHIEFQSTHESDVPERMST